MIYLILSQHFVFHSKFEVFPMKKALPLLLALLLCLSLLAACSPGGDDASSSTPPLTTPGGTPSPSGAAVSDVSSLPQSSASSSGQIQSGTSTSGSQSEELQSITGVIDGAAMRQLYVEVEGGLVIPFPHDGVDTTKLESTFPGSPITVYFTGTLDGNDSSGVTVVRMETP